MDTDYAESTPAEGDEQRQDGHLAAAISTGVVKLVREYTGRGPTKARTIISRGIVMVLLEDTLTKAERNLSEVGKGELVKQIRAEFQGTMRADMVACVEANLQRKVIAFMSANHIDPDMGAEIFVLEPPPVEEI